MYDSTEDTKQHIRRVQELVSRCCAELTTISVVHDASKLSETEKHVFDQFTPKLKESTYGSDEYKGFLEAMKPALEHHYARNRHHPEHFDSGVCGMDLFDLIEMYFDWKAASERHENGSFANSIQHNAVRFGIGLQLTSIFENTRKNLDW